MKTDIHLALSLVACDIIYSGPSLNLHFLLSEYEAVTTSRNLPPITEVWLQLTRIYNYAYQTTHADVL